MYPCLTTRELTLFSLLCLSVCLPNSICKHSLFLHTEFWRAAWDQVDGDFRHSCLCFVFEVFSGMQGPYSCGSGYLLPNYQESVSCSPKRCQIQQRSLCIYFKPKNSIFHSSRDLDSHAAPSVEAYPEYPRWGSSDSVIWKYSPFGLLGHVIT